jgi:hypothetical protein
MPHLEMKLIWLAGRDLLAYDLLNKGIFTTHLIILSLLNDSFS